MTTASTEPTHDLVITANRAVLPDGVRPAAVVIDGERITAVVDPGAAPIARERI